MDAPLLECIEIETARYPRASVIWLHGLGADGSDFAPLVPELRLGAAAPIRFIFPHAPHRKVTINGGYKMPAWYDILGTGGMPNVKEDEEGIHASARSVQALIAREVKRGIRTDAIVLAGFSQGCAMVLHTGLRYKHKLAGIVGLSGYLPLAPHLQFEASDENRETPIFLAHGTGDPMIALARAEASRDALLKLRYPVEWHTYPMPHSVHPQEIGDIGEFLIKVLPPQHKA